MYYYNARTRESAWTKPENVKIITQSEVETMAAAQSANGGMEGGVDGEAAPSGDMEDGEGQCHWATGQRTLEGACD